MIQHCAKCASVPEHERTVAAKFQDERHGYDQRVHNPRPSNGNTVPKPRCTVCGQ